jgi:cytochrome c
MALLASADPKAGEADIGLCKVCHTFNKGGATLVGPNLYGVVGRKIASVEGFNYTPALKAHEGDWTFDKLDAWLTNPAAFAPGTMMAFPGIPDAKKRADVIAYLNSNSDSPLPLPKPGAGGAQEEKKSEAPAAAPAVPAAAPGAAPSAETPPPSAETPPAPAETPAAAASEAAPSAETPPPSAETPPASTETPAAASETAPPAETPPAADAAPAGEDSILTNQPQPVYPEGSPQ